MSLKSSKRTSSYYVAYLDLLGTTQKIKTDRNDVYLNEIYKAIDYATRINEQPTGSEFITQYQGEIKTKIFSDNILFAIPAKSADPNLDMLSAMMKIVALLQSKLLKECSWLSRGAITRGELFIDENFVWGKALVRAYSLESKLAIYPRIIIDPEIMKYYHYPGQDSALSFLKGMGLDKDKDGLYHVNMTSVLLLIEQSKLLSKIEEICGKAHTEGNDYKVIQKYDWLRNAYLNKLDNQ